MRTSTQLMTALHVLLLQGKKSAEDTLQTAKLLMDHGLRELINEPDSLGNTPLHALIVRYALEVIKLGSVQILYKQVSPNSGPPPRNAYIAYTI